MTRDPSMVPGSGVPADRTRSTVQMFALVIGVIYVLVGLLGLIPIPALVHTTVPGDPALRSSFANLYYGRLLGLFPVNLLLSIIHVFIGVWGMLAFRTISGSIGFARGLAIIYLLLAVLGLIPNDLTRTVFGLVPIYSHNVWLHAVTGLIAAYFGFATPMDRVTTTDRI